MVGLDRLLVLEQIIRRRAWAGPRAPLVVSVPAVFFAILLAVPLVYLVIRTAELGGDVWDYISRPRTVAVLLQTIALAASTTALATAIGVPLAWLTTSTDLPGRR